MSSDILRDVFSKVLLSSDVGEALTVLWHIGEPLAVPVAFYEEAFAIASLINQGREDAAVHVTHSVQTNGTLIHQTWCDLFRNWDVAVGLSIDGPEWMHDAHRKRRNGNGTHTEVMRGIRLLLRNSIPFSVVTVLTADSLDHADEMFDFFVENGVTNVGFNVEEITGVNVSSSVMRRDMEDRYRAFMGRFLERTSQQPAGQLRVREFDLLGRRLIGRPNYRQNQLCTPLAIVSVDVNGNVGTFCPELLSARLDNNDNRGFTLANIAELDNLRSVLEAPRFSTLNEQVQTGVEVCRATCAYFEFCKGGAPSNKYFETGEFAVGETEYCRFTRKILLDLLLTKLEAAVAPE